MTTGELIRLLEEYPEDTEVVISIDTPTESHSASVLGTEAGGSGECIISNEGLR
jgi:hypothetical protein